MAVFAGAELFAGREKVATAEYFVQNLKSAVIPVCLRREVHRESFCGGETPRHP